MAHYEVLLCETAWLRRVSRSLVANPDLADDVAQNVLLYALAHGNTAIRRPRAWLGRIAQNMARRLLARERVRRRVEELACRPDTSPGAGDLVELAARHRAVVEALSRLEQPYRTAVALRYLNDLTVAEVADRTGVGIEAARTRIKRGLARLRAAASVEDHRMVWPH